MKKLSRLFWLILYYGFARYLPASYRPIVGKLSRGLRNQCARHLFKKCGHSINIDHMANFGSGAGVELGNHSCMGVHCHFPNDIKIGEYVMFGPHCHILGNVTHNYDRVDIPIGEQGSRRIEKRTVIGNDVWMGRQCLMIPGHVVGDHSIVGAGSVVSKDIPEYSVAVGNPVRVIRDRRDHVLTTKTE